MKRIFAFIFFSSILSSCVKNNLSPYGVVEVINKGVSGNTVVNLLNRVNSDVLTQYPDLVIIMIGTNDSKTAGEDFINYNANLSALIDQIKSSGIDVMLVTPPPIAKTSYAYDWSSRLETICNAIKQISKSKNCYLADINSDLDNIILQKGSPDIYLSDGLHPNQVGDMDIGTYISSYMQTKAINKTKIVCFGDSITYGYLLTGAGTAMGDTYPAVLQRNLSE